MTGREQDWTLLFEKGDVPLSFMLAITHETDSSKERIIINADDDDNDDMSESTVSCDDNDDIQGVGPIVSDSEWSEVISEVKWLVKWSE